MILTYYSLFLINSSIKNINYKKIIIGFFLITSLFSLHTKFFQYNTGFIGHHNFFAALCLLVITLSFNMFIFTKDKIKYIYLIIGFIFLP